jgi:hypothetical protein
MTELTRTTAFAAAADIVILVAGDDLARRGPQPGGI